MSDEQLDQLPKRTAIGHEPRVTKGMALKTILSGLIADLRRVIGRRRDTA